jgi:hypothetical protein
VAADAAGNVYVTGYSGSDYATLKYSPAGDELWVMHYNSGEDYAYGIELDAAASVYVTGASTGAETEWDFATVRYSQRSACGPRHQANEPSKRCLRPAMQD